MASVQHKPLDRQAERFAREGDSSSPSTLADQVGAAANALAPLNAWIAEHFLAAKHLHGDDTTVPVLVNGKTRTERLWTNVRNDQPLGGPAPPAALFRYSPDRQGRRPEAQLKGWTGVLQADAYAGFSRLYHVDLDPAPIQPALCCPHGRRKS
jgi:hypothetical protein